LKSQEAQSKPNLFSKTGILGCRRRDSKHRLLAGLESGAIIFQV
jgi:uncharacterized membrane protein (UPF0136 family)